MHPPLEWAPEGAEVGAGGQVRIPAAICWASNRRRACASGLASGLAHVPASPHMLFI